MILVPGWRNPPCRSLEACARPCLVNRTRTTGQSRSAAAQRIVSLMFLDELKHFVEPATERARELERELERG
jgi:hypothetical protein